MSIQTLKDQIRDTGAADAIITLHPKLLQRQELSAMPAKGQIVRQAPKIEPKILSDLSSQFQLGWSELRKSLAVDAMETSSFTPTIRRLLSGDHLQQGSHMIHFPHLGIVYGAVTLEGLQALENHHAVGNIQHASNEISLIQPVSTGVNRDGLTGELAWGIARMQAPQLWEKNFTGSGILIAHMDTGADSTHPALKNAITNARMISNDGKESHEEIPYTDTASHGTHTAGVVAGRSDTGGPIVGMAPDASLVCATVINDGETFARLLAGLEFALQANARIVSISLGIKGFDDSLHGIMDTVRAQQLLPVVAIGNDPLSSYSPGNYDNVLSVGASDKDDQVAPFSSSAKAGGPGVGPVLCAPGKDIYSSVPGNKYQTENGSSMSVPHVAGLAALLLSARPDASIDQVQEALVASCENPAGADESRIGAGIPNGLKALKMIGADASNP